ncbi:MAG: RNA 2',3'-cyclic phosphodiesterase [Elusimicrobia bacterium]|nr:RNA 2',3'-cyclic phosphodiesterase [Elusimicrobiota bacterium]
MRIFIAVEVQSAVVRDAIYGILLALKETRADVKWVGKENLHVTLKFLGQTPKENVPEIKKMLENLLADKKRFNVSLGRIGAFPGITHPRVIWLGVSEGGKNMEEIAEGIDAQLLGLGFAGEKRAFSSHITLGRVKSSKNLKNLTDKIEAINRSTGGPAGTFVAGYISVMESNLSPKGPKYTALERIPLLGVLNERGNPLVL